MYSYDVFAFYALCFDIIVGDTMTSCPSVLIMVQLFIIFA